MKKHRQAKQSTPTSFGKRLLQRRWIQVSASAIILLSTLWFGAIALINNSLVPKMETKVLQLVNTENEVLSVEKVRVTPFLGIRIINMQIDIREDLSLHTDVTAVRIKLWPIISQLLRGNTQSLASEFPQKLLQATTGPELMAFIKEYRWMLPSIVRIHNAAFRLGESRVDIIEAGLMHSKRNSSLHGYISGGKVSSSELHSELRLDGDLNYLTSLLSLDVSLTGDMAMRLQVPESDISALRYNLELSAIKTPLGKFSADIQGDYRPFEQNNHMRPEIAMGPAPEAAPGVMTAQGNVALGSVVGTIDAEVRGIPAASDRLNELPIAFVPEYLELSVMADSQQIADLRDLIPREYLGGLAEAIVSGTVSGRADFFVPFYNLGRMEWEISPEINGLEISGLPDSIDIPGLMGTSIYHPDYEQPIAIEILPYRRPSIEWMLAHSEHDENWVLQRWALFDEGPTGGIGFPIPSETGETAVTAISGEAISPDIATVTDVVMETSVSEAAAEFSVEITSENSLEGSYRYLEDISPYVISAILSSEDGDFFFHAGVDLDTVYAAIARNIREGDIVFGASTISMQLVKNWFLSQDRNFERKIQEILTVMLMEEYFYIPKERVLELYLNTVEMGPGIYGINAAAEHYFGIEAADMTLGQALWIASILPSPVRYHRYYDAGAMSPGWFEWMLRNLDVMLERGRIDEEEYQSVIDAGPPEFFYPEADETTG